MENIEVGSQAMLEELLSSKKSYIFHMLIIFVNTRGLHDNLKLCKVKILVSSFHPTIILI